MTQFAVGDHVLWKGLDTAPESNPDRVWVVKGITRMFTNIGDDRSITEPKNFHVIELGAEDTETKRYTAGADIELDAAWYMDQVMKGLRP